MTLQKTFQEKSTKNIITKIYDLESREVIVRELINGFRIKGHSGKKWLDGVLKLTILGFFKKLSRWCSPLNNGMIFIFSNDGWEVYLSTDKSRLENCAIYRYISVNQIKSSIDVFL